MEDKGIDSLRIAATRRGFLTKSATGILASATALSVTKASLAQSETNAASTENLPPNVPEWTQSPGEPTALAYGQPSRYETEAIRHMYPGFEEPMSSASISPLQELDGIITPNGLHYERNHSGVPQIDPTQHRLIIHGLTERDWIFTMAELREFQMESKIYFLECSGNPFFVPPYGKTAAEVAGLVSGAQWTGVPLRTLLEYVGVKPEAKWIVAEGADGSAMTRSIPIEKCKDDVLVAFSQNGERLRPEQGYPIRLFVPGYEGNMSIKWLRRLQITDEPVHSREETSKYTDLMPNGLAREFSYVMECKSIITYPSGTHKLTRKGIHQLRGIAWSGLGKIAHVDVSIDGGRNWREASLDDPILSKALTSFKMEFEWDGAELILVSRAVDETGYVQPTLQQLLSVRGKLSTYHNNAIQPWKISRDGEVTNGRV